MENESQLLIINRRPLKRSDPAPGDPGDAWCTNDLLLVLFFGSWKVDIYNVYIYIYTVLYIYVTHTHMYTYTQEYVDLGHGDTSNSVEPWANL